MIQNKPCDICGRVTFLTDSYFIKNNKICIECDRNEKELIKRLPDKGVKYKHCGYIPIKHAIK